MSEPDGQFRSRTTIFFDQGAPLLDACHAGCKFDRKTLCRHRLGFVADIIVHDDRMGYLGYSDQQVALFFRFLIRKKYPKEDLDQRLFIIATTDGKFVRDARQEHDKPRKNWKKPRVKFDEEENIIVAEEVEIRIVRENCDSCVKRKTRAVRCMIDRLNTSWKEFQRQK